MELVLLLFLTLYGVLRIVDGPKPPLAPKWRTAFIVVALVVAWLCYLVITVHIGSHVAVVR